MSRGRQCPSRGRSLLPRLPKHARALKLILSLLFFSLSVRAQVIQQVRVGSHADYIRVVFETDAPMEAVTSVPESGVIELLFSGRKAISRQASDLESELISVRFYEKTRGGLSARLEPRVQWSSVETFTLADPDRVVVDVSRGNQGGDAKAAPGRPAALNLKTAALESDGPDEAVNRPLDEEGSEPQPNLESADAASLSPPQVRQPGGSAGAVARMTAVLIAVVLLTACLSVTALLLSLRTWRLIKNRDFGAGADERCEQEIAELDTTIEELLARDEALLPGERG